MTDAAAEQDPIIQVERRDRSAENVQRRAVYSLPVDVIISLGQKRLSVAEVLKLQVDTIVPLEARIDDPIEMIVDNNVLALCELIETEDGKLGVKITKILDSPNV